MLLTNPSFIFSSFSLQRSAPEFFKHPWASSGSYDENNSNIDTWDEKNLSDVGVPSALLQINLLTGEDPLGLPFNLTSHLLLFFSFFLCDNKYKEQKLHQMRDQVLITKERSEPIPNKRLEPKSL